MIFQTNNKRAILTGISIFSPFGTKNRLKVKHYIEYIFTIIIIKISKSKVIAQKIGNFLERRHFPFQILVIPQPDLSRNISNHDSISCAQLYARVYVNLDTFRDDRSRKSFHFLFIFFFFLRERVRSLRGSVEMKGEPEGADG